MKKTTLYLILIFMIVLGFYSYSYGDYEYEIRKDDCLWDIAIKRLCVPPAEFANFLENVRMNNSWLEDVDYIYPGKILNITDRFSEYKERSDIEIEPINPPQSYMSLKTGTQEYVVRRGESLWSIGSKVTKTNDNIELIKFYKTCINLNPEIKDPDMIYPGQKIMIPGYSDSVRRVGSEIEEEKNDPIISEESPLGKILNDTSGKSTEEIDKLLLNLDGYEMMKAPVMEISIGKSSLRINADRLLMPQDISTAGDKSEYLLNYINSPEDLTPEKIKNILSQKGINLIEIFVE